MAVPEPVFSVVIPAFNDGARLPGAVSHVFGLIEQARVCERFGPVEVVVVDDGSVDDTATVLSELATRFDITVVSQGNQGVASARNAGIRASSGVVIGMLDSDDRWDPAIVEELLPSILATDSTPMVQGRIRDTWHDRVGPAYESVNLGAVLFRRSVFDEVGLFDERLRRLEDYEWFVRAFDLRVPKTRRPCVVLHYLRRVDGLTMSAPKPDRLLVRVHRDANLRRRQGLTPLPEGFPTIQEYFGVPPSEAERRSVDATAGGDPAPTDARAGSTGQRSEAPLVRIDTRAIADEPGVRGFLCVRNERQRLPALLDHHRRLGVRSFFVIDNGSTDDSLTWLDAQADVHLWQSTGSFRASRFGLDWMLPLLERFGRDRWCVVVDADELLILPQPRDASLDSYCDALDREQVNAVLGIMVDVYPGGRLRDAVFQPGDDPLAVCQWFDRNVWTTRVHGFFDHVSHESFFGGVRHRVFGSPASVTRAGGDQTYYTLNKVPLFRYTPEHRFSPSFHWVAGAKMSTSRCALLHWKYTADLVTAASEEVGRAEHWDGASQYEGYVRALHDPDFSLYDPETSMAYDGPEQLLALGVTVPIATGPSPAPMGAMGDRTDATRESTVRAPHDNAE